jgi:putative nucleotidyltransferase with HDIG domain
MKSGVCPFASSLARLSAAADSPDPEPVELAKVLETDPALASAILRSVNSSSYGLKSPCASVRRAVPLLGTRGTVQVARATSILANFSFDTPVAKALLDHAQVVAALSSYFAKVCLLPKEDAYTIGLLHDVGKMMLLHTDAARYESILGQYSNGGDTSQEAERALYGYDHAILGAQVLRAWKIPEPMPQIIQWHHDRSRAYEEGGKIGMMVRILRLADFLAWALEEYDEPTEEMLAVLDGDPLDFHLPVTTEGLALRWEALRAIRNRAVAIARGEEFQAEGEEGSAGEPRPSDEPPEASASEKPQAPSHGCGICGEVNLQWRCPRCRKPLCTSHVPGQEEACAHCEAEFRLKAPENLRLRVVLTLIVGALSMGGTVFLTRAAVAATFAVMVAAVTFVMHSHAERDRFMRGQGS